MDKFVYGMYGNEDQLDNNDRLYNKFLDIFILNPRTHIKHGKALFTDYEIHVKTNHPEFAIKDSYVRRRYSEFAWLKARLGMNDIMMTTAPSLPGKKYVGRFKDPFLMKRQMGLQSFMNKVVEVNPFLSDPALHLFLQTDLSISQMESYLKHGVLLSNIRDRVIAEQKLREQRKKDTDVSTDSQCKDRSCTLSRSFSLDTLLSISKEEKFEDKVCGRGWSNYIGNGVCHNQVLADKDVTDFPALKSSTLYTAQNKKTARVLPGGQLQLADDPSDMQDISNLPKPQTRPASWHGKTFDMVDYILDTYDVIESDPTACIDSVSISHTFNQNNSTSTIDNSSSYSDDEVEVDIMSRLQEYSIISPIPFQGEEVFERTTSASNTRVYRLSNTINESDATTTPLRSARSSYTSFESESLRQTPKLPAKNTYASLDTKGFRHSDSE